jgi:hypothetical protein
MTDREREIVELLVSKVRIMCFEQIARTWWSLAAHGRWHAEQALERLECDKWLEHKKGLSRVVRKLSEPVFEWTPGQEPGDFSALSATLHRRARTPVRTMTVWMATSRAAALLGRHTIHGVNATQTTHDLQVAEILLYYRQSGLSISSEWLGEIEFAHFWPYAERPDALLTRNGAVIRAVEYGGDYTPVTVGGGS